MALKTTAGEVIRCPGGHRNLRETVDDETAGCTPGNPPLEVRICFAISFATAISCVSRYTLNATRNGRAPIAVTPPSDELVGPKSGANVRSRNARIHPCECRAGRWCSGRVAPWRRGTPESPALCPPAHQAAGPGRRTLASYSHHRHKRHDVCRAMRGCSPLFGEVDPVGCDAHGCECRFHHGSRVADEGEHERLCAVSLCTSSNRTPVTAVMAERSASIVAASRPSEKFGTHSTTRGHQLFLNRSMSQRCIAALPRRWSSSDVTQHVCGAVGPGHDAARFANEQCARRDVPRRELPAPECIEPPSATSARSSAAAPARRMPLAAPITAANCDR